MRKEDEPREVIVDKYLETILIPLARNSCPCGKNTERTWDS
jgi:hypothetical protein